MRFIHSSGCPRLVRVPPSSLLRPSRHNFISLVHYLASVPAALNSLVLLRLVFAGDFTRPDSAGNSRNFAKRTPFVPNSNFRLRDYRPRRGVGITSRGERGAGGSLWLLWMQRVAIKRARVPSSLFSRAIRIYSYTYTHVYHTRSQYVVYVELSAIPDSEGEHV